VPSEGTAIRCRAHGVDAAVPAGADRLAGVRRRRHAAWRGGVGVTGSSGGKEMRFGAEAPDCLSVPAANVPAAAACPASKAHARRGLVAPRFSVADWGSLLTPGAGFTCRVAPVASPWFRFGRC